jgi:hypothetical protein
MRFEMVGVAAHASLNGQDTAYSAVFYKWPCIRATLGRRLSHSHGPIFLKRTLTLPKHTLAALIARSAPSRFVRSADNLKCAGDRTCVDHATYWTKKEASERRGTLLGCNVWRNTFSSVRPLIHVTIRRAAAIWAKGGKCAADIYPP